MTGRHFRLKLAAVVSGTLLVVAGAQASANVAVKQVSSDPYTNTSSYHATEVEPDTFANGSLMVSAFQTGRFRDGGSSNIGWATTANTGATYVHGFLPGTTGFASPVGPFARISDPAVTFDARHGVWLISSLGLSQVGGGVKGAAVLVNRSTDGAKTFANPISVATASSAQAFDKNWIVCDTTSTSPHFGNCYVEWDDNGASNHLMMAWSSDGGVTWRPSAVPVSGVIGGQPLVQPNGTVVMPINDGNETAVQSFVSTDGGLSYKGPFTVASVSAHTVAGGLRTGPLPTAEINKAGTVYVAWQDCRFRSGCASNDIVYSSSSDGVTWSPVTRIPIDATTSGADHFIPGLAVDRTTSGATTKLALTYYFYPATSCTTATCQLDVGFVGSADNGATWTAPQQLAGPTALSQLPNTTQGFMVGDYLSTSFVKARTGTLALSVFAVGKPVAGRSCTVGDLTSCNVAMNAPSAGLAANASGSPGPWTPQVAPDGQSATPPPPAGPLTAY